MKRVVSVSLGSSERDHAVEVDLLGEKFIIERLGTDGSKEKAIQMIRDLDGKVDAFGMGGIDLYVWAGRKRLILKDALPIARAAVKTPIVDGSGLKNTLERRVVKFIAEANLLPLRNLQTLMVSGVDRFGMAEALMEEGADVTFGDLAFVLGIPVSVKSWQTIERLGHIIGPIVTRLPFEWLYPTGDKQKENTPKYSRFYRENVLIAGDRHFVFRYMPKDMRGKVVLTNTVTKQDVEDLRRRGARTLITTTPELNGRSFGTNVMEGVLIALAGKTAHELAPDDYHHLLDRIDFRPRVEHFSPVDAAATS